MEQKVRAVYVCMSDHTTVEKIAMQYHADSYDCYFAFSLLPLFLMTRNRVDQHTPGQNESTELEREVTPQGRLNLGGDFHKVYIRQVRGPRKCKRGNVRARVLRSRYTL
jgi:hypothetical protein